MRVTGDLDQSSMGGGVGRRASLRLCRQIELEVASSKKSSLTHPCHTAASLLQKPGPLYKQPRVGLRCMCVVGTARCRVFRKGPSPRSHLGTRRTDSRATCLGPTPDTPPQQLCDPRPVT